MPGPGGYCTKWALSARNGAEGQLGKAVVLHSGDPRKRPAINLLTTEQLSLNLTPNTVHEHVPGRNGLWRS
jgi:hypothetical protein